MGKYNIGTYLQCARKAAGMTHVQACTLPDGEEICTIENLSRIENGKRRPHPNTLNKLLKKYGKEEVFGNSYVKTADYDVLILDKQLSIAMAEFRYEEARGILEQIEEKLSTRFLSNRQYLAANYVMIGVELGDITQEESVALFTEIVQMTLPVFETKSFEKAFVSQREAIIILQIGNAYGNLKEYGKALEVLEGTYANLMRYQKAFHYADGIYAVYERAIIKWKGEAGAFQEAFERGEREIARVFENGYMDTLAGLVYAQAYNLDKMLGEDGKTEEKRSEINSGYEVAALVSELFEENEISDFIRRKIK